MNANSSWPGFGTKALFFFFFAWANCQSLLWSSVVRTAVFSATFAKLKCNDLASLADTKSLCSCCGAERRNVKCVEWRKLSEIPCLTPCLQSHVFPSASDWGGDKRQIRAEKFSWSGAVGETQNQMHSRSFLNRSLEQKEEVMNIKFNLEFSS